ncbi:MAG: type II toxin-antitoxin system RelB/DinJ family antitoxin [Oscillospiraceae bacterium]|nr:type II toxin-antitoxin system RelB/DinJ family antitoxin [Oscillospiraceae bacterium]
MKKTVKSASMHIRVCPDVKEKAMCVLNEIGISASDLFNMLLSQVAIQHKVPFELVDSQYVCAYGHLHDYSNIPPPKEEEYHTFNTWAEAKEWLNAG